MASISPPEHRPQERRRREPPEPTDRKLLPGVDRQAIRACIYRIVRDIDVVDDIEQEVSIIWHRQQWRWHLVRFRTAYACTIARHQAFKWLDRQKKEGQQRARLLLMSKPVMPTVRNPIDEIALPEELEQLLSGLRAEYRHAWLRQRLGWRVKEIAGEMGVKSHTVKHYVTQAAEFFEIGLMRRKEGNLP